MKPELLLLTVLGTICSGLKYDCVKHPAQAMCSFPVVGADCTGKTDVSISKADIKTIVAAHNHFREIIAFGNQTNLPAARDMQLMSYDNDLAAVSQRLVDQCKIKTDPDRRLYDGDKAVSYGQILSETMSTSNVAVNFTGFISSWFSEVGSFKRTNIDKFVSDSKNGRFTQLAWAKSYKVGCGLSKFKTTIKEQEYNAYLFICSYAPAGNVRGAKIYTQVKDPSKEKYGDLCTLPLSKDYPALCTTPDVKAIDIVWETNFV